VICAPEEGFQEFAELAQRVGFFAAS
jgi:hypothetical protein